MTCRRRSASTTSASVDRNDAIRWGGSFRMNPTVSERRTLFPGPGVIFRTVVSSVAKRRSSMKTSAPVSAWKSVDLPALV
jgi:hypothetical protein